MDEFCANKDTQLKRCACSARINEFDGIKRQLSNIDDKMLDFNQRLLAVNMDKEDALAMYQATEGELAFNQKDTSQSKKMLDEIAKKLNTTFDDSSFNQNLGALSWSLNMDSAFDNVDSLGGASTTAKSGTDLYAAALPICREMALEVCSEDEFEIAQSGYLMSIEQDCNTVAKTYETQTDKVRDQIRESSALLDMSRLDIYQKRNSDDILTCKKKMLDMLTDPTVCGKDLGKCLDTSGRYIDPSTGEAFLTVDLANLGNLISRPDTNQTWTSAPGNEKFVTYLYSKKKYLEPAMENCQDISDYVWDSFIEDALAQIKLAQENKLEDVRQSCTTLTAQCLSNTADSLADFDARALSSFGVNADKTAKAICADVQTACSALLDTMGSGDEWTTGMTDIANAKTYETILQTCREVGRACIIQSCKSISGNFGLCEDIQTSVNRKAIINKTSCWAEVQKCVENAGAQSIEQIMSKLEGNQVNKETGTFYSYLYGNNITLQVTNPAQQISTVATLSDILNNITTADDSTPKQSPETCYKQDATNPLNCVYDLCAAECGYRGYDNGKPIYENAQSHKCRVCRITEKIWGNCESAPTSNLKDEGSHNRIRIPTNSEETLLSWFATNTGTDQRDDSCRDTTCGIGYTPYQDNTDPDQIICISNKDIVAGEMCIQKQNSTFVVTNAQDKNCCHGNIYTTTYANSSTQTLCCQAKSVLIDENISKHMDLYTNNYFIPFYNDPDIKITLQSMTDSPKTTLCLPPNTDANNVHVVAKYTNNGNDNIFVLCIGRINKTPDATTDEYPNGNQIKCDGKYILYNYDQNTYFDGKTLSNTNNNSTTNTPTMFYRTQDGHQCTWDPKNGWPQTEGCETPTAWRIGYSTKNK